MFKRAAVATILALALLAPPAAAQESPMLQRVIKAKEIRVGTSGDYRPFSHLDPKSGEYQGMDIEMAHLLAGSLGAKAVFVRFKWPEVSGDLLADKFDVAMGGIGRNLNRGLTLAYTHSYMTFGTCPLTRRGEEARYPDFAAIDQPGVRVILNKGGLNDRHFTPLLKRATIVRHDKNDEIAIKVKDGEADVWITDNVEALFWAKELPGLAAVNPRRTFTVGTKGYMVRQGDQVFLNWLNLWLEQMALQGEVARLEKKWLGMALSADK